MKKQERQYEITFLASEEGLDQEVKKIIESLKGKVEEVNNWGRQELAYQIKGHNAANYTTIVFAAAAEKLFELDGKIKRLDDIIRHLTVEAVPKPSKIEIITAKEIVREEKIEEKQEEKKPKVKIKEEAIKKEKKVEEKEDSDERLKKLDEKLDEILAE